MQQSTTHTFVVRLCPHLRRRQTTSAMNPMGIHSGTFTQCWIKPGQRSRHQLDHIQDCHFDAGSKPVQRHRRWTGFESAFEFPRNCKFRQLGRARSWLDGMGCDGILAGQLHLMCIGIGLSCGAIAYACWTGGKNKWTVLLGAVERRGAAGGGGGGLRNISTRYFILHSRGNRDVFAILPKSDTRQNLGSYLKSVVCVCIWLKVSL